MSTLKVNQIKSKLRQKFEDQINTSDIAMNDKERDIKILSRCLSAQAVQMTSDCESIDAAQSVWDGCDDNGIDAAYYDQSNRCVIIVQSKFIQNGSGEPALADINKFLDGAKDLINMENDGFRDELHNKISEIHSALEIPGTGVKIVTVSTGKSLASKHASQKISKFLKVINGDDPEPIATSQTLGLSEVYNYLAESGEDANPEIEANILQWNYISTPFSAYFGIIDGASVRSWWIEHGKKILSKNIRHSLGTTDVNTEIAKTATSHPENFWYFNNGITIVCDHIEKAPAKAASKSAGIFKLCNASIVNGAQTASTLGNIESPESLALVRIPIRIIDLSKSPGDFGSQVTRANNLQNRIEQRDFAAQDPEQRRIKNEMALEGIDYILLRSSESEISETSCDLNEVTTSLACAYADPNLAVAVKTGIGRFYSDLKKAPYKTLFNPQTSGAYAFNCVLVQREIDKWIAQAKIENTAKKGASWGTLVHGNRILSSAIFKRINKDLLNKPINDFKLIIDSLDIALKCETTHALMCNSVTTNFSKNFLAVLFKNPANSKSVFDQIT